MVSALLVLCIEIFALEQLYAQQSQINPPDNNLHVLNVYLQSVLFYSGTAHCAAGWGCEDDIFVSNQSISQSINSYRGAIYSSE